VIVGAAPAAQVRSRHGFFDRPITTSSIMLTAKRVDRLCAAGLTDRERAQLAGLLEKWSRNLQQQPD